MNLERIIAVRNTKTIYRDGNQCIKVFNVGFSKADVLNEALNQARVEETGLAIPRILEVTTIEGKWVIVSEYIKGKTLARLMEENQEKKAEYLEQLVDLQCQVHARACPLLNGLKDILDRKISQAELSATTRYDLHTRLEEMPKQRKLCHMDFGPSNIIVAEDGTPYILDWAHAAQGNPSADAAQTCLLLRLSGDSEGARQYLDCFCQKSSIEKQDVQRWMPMVAASQSIRAREKDRGQLLSWAESADWE